MDTGSGSLHIGNGFDDHPLQLPADLPRSLDDRIRTPPLPTVTEVYDGWQGETQYITAPVPARLNFDIGLDYRDDEDDFKGLAESDRRLESMLAAQAASSRAVQSSEEDEKVAGSTDLSDEEKTERLQRALNMAAMNGEEERIKGLLKGKARKYIDINAPDEDGTSPLIYASCFGNEGCVEVLLGAGANVDQQDSHHWSSLTWATTNKHKGIAKMLLDHGASPEIKTQSGKTAFDFVEPRSEMYGHLHDNGYIGRAGVEDDFYDSGLANDRFEEEMMENEMRRRMMMESAVNLEVDLSSLGLDEQAEVPEEEEEEDEDNPEFVWDRCLHDQMFVFQEDDLDRILDVVVTNMTPQRSRSQKPVPANVLFLSARYAHYHSSSDLLSKLLLSAMMRINKVVERYQWDMTMLAFWLSNATLLLYYLKKDVGLVTATTSFQQRLSELINEIFILIIRDAERRMDKQFDPSLLDHETIPGFEDVHFQNEWRLFKTKKKNPDPPLPMEKRFRPPSPKQRMKPSPRNITSLLSSTLFVLDLYDIHSVIISQLFSQLFYWLGSELFNRIMSNRKYLARTKAMQIRLNISTLEDWARTNNRQPEHFETGSLNPTGETIIDSSKRHLAPVIQLLQWLQCFSSLGSDLEALKSTIDQLPRLTAQQLLHAAKNYRPEVEEKGLTKEAMKYLSQLHADHLKKRQHNRMNSIASLRNPNTSPPPASPSPTDSKQRPKSMLDLPDDDDAPEHLLLDSGFMLPFSLPTSTDMLVTYGAGLGGMNRERARKYSPTVPPEFLAKLEGFRREDEARREKEGRGGWTDDEEEQE